VADQLSKQLWVALSGAFVDGDVDYKYIASIARGYSLSHVEFAFFERVAPVCIYNMLAPIPPVCWFFDEDQLFLEIELLIHKRASGGVVRMGVVTVQRWFMRLVCRGLWAEIKAEIEKAKIDT